LSPRTPHPSRLGRANEYAQLVESLIPNAMNGDGVRLDDVIRMAPG